MAEIPLLGGSFRLTRPGVAGLVTAVLVIIADQISKIWILRGLNLSPEGCLEFVLASREERAFLVNTCRHIEISGVFDLTMVWNRGVSFGLLGADNDLGRWLLVVFSVVVGCLLLLGLAGIGPLRIREDGGVQARKTPLGNLRFDPVLLQAIAFGFIAGGAIGNAIDRSLYGAVVDFLNFSGLYFPWVFNIADVGVNLGVGLILLGLLLGDGSETRSES